MRHMSLPLCSSVRARMGALLRVGSSWAAPLHLLGGQPATAGPGTRLMLHGGMASAGWLRSSPVPA